jgi:hypothetical protein
VCKILLVRSRYNFFDNVDVCFRHDIQTMITFSRLLDSPRAALASYIRHLTLRDERGDTKWLSRVLPRCEITDGGTDANLQICKRKRPHHVMRSLPRTRELQVWMYQYDWTWYYVVLVQLSMTITVPFVFRLTLAPSFSSQPLSSRFPLYVYPMLQPLWEDWISEDGCVFQTDPASVACCLLDTNRCA